MAIDLVICNQALGLIGARNVITDPNEDSTEGAACRTFYDTSRQIILRENDWAFARKQAALALAAGSPITPYAYKYTYPADCISFRRIIPPAGGGSLTLLRRFIVQTDAGVRVISSDVQSAIGIYTFDVTDTTLFDALFRDATAYVLASKLCMALTGNVQLAGSFMTMAQTVVENAETADSNEANSGLSILKMRPEAKNDTQRS